MCIFASKYISLNYSPYLPCKWQISHKVTLDVGTGLYTPLLSKLSLVHNLNSGDNQLHIDLSDTIDPVTRFFPC